MKSFIKKLTLISFIVFSVFFVTACKEPSTTYTITTTQTTGGQVYASKTEAEQFDSITLSYILTDGYTFKHFTLNGEQIEGNTFSMPDKNVTVSAVFELDGYAINVESLNGGSVFANKNVAKQGETISLGVYTNPGYTFKHFTLNNEQIEGNTFVMPQEAVEISAVFETITYTLDYELSGGTIAQTNPENYNVEQEISLTSPTKENYDFVGWYKNQEFTGEVITKINFGTTGNLTLFAKFTPTKYAINYHLYGGENNSNNPNFYTIESSISSLEEPTRPGYAFIAWYKDENFNNMFYNINPGSSGEINVYAKYTPIFEINHLGEIAGITGYAQQYLKRLVIPTTVDGITITKVAGVTYSNLEYLEIPATIANFDRFAFFNNEKLETVVLHEGLTTIKEGMFADCVVLKNITLPQSLETIESSAFSSCDKLENLIIPKNVTKIETLAFSDTMNTINLSVEQGNSCYKIENNCLVELSTKTVIFGMTADTITIPNGVEKIAEYSFRSSSIKHLIIPEGVTHIGIYAFSTCVEIETVKLPSTLKYIGAYAFSAIGGRWSDCTYPTIVIPTGVEYIGENNFSSPCTLIFEATTPAPEIIGNFDYAVGQYFAKIYVPDDSVEAYKTAFKRDDIFAVSTLNQED